MAVDTLSTIAYSLSRQEERLKDFTTRCFKYPLLALLKDGNKITTLRSVGRTMYRYFNGLVYPGGGFHSVAESGDYPAAQAESEDQVYAKLKLHAMTVGYSEHALKAMEIDPGAITVNLQEKLKASISNTQDRMLRLFTARGDGVVARVDTAGSSTTVSSSIPVRVVPGDLVYSKTDTSGDGRGLGGTAKIGGVRVTDVDYRDYSFTLASAITHVDNDVVYLTNAANNASGAGTYMQGLEAHCDSSVDNWQWDDDDDSTYDHVDTYPLGGTRGTTHGMNVQEVDGASGYLDIDALCRMAEECQQVGANPADLALVCSPTQWRLFAMSLIGYRPRSEKVQLVGGDYTVRVIDGVTETPLKVICDYGIMDTEVIMLDTDKLYQLTADGGWNKRNGNMWKQVAGATNTSATKYEAYFDIWKETVLMRPYTTCVGYDFLQA